MIAPPQSSDLVDSFKIIACHGNSPKAASNGPTPLGTAFFKKKSITIIKTFVLLYSNFKILQYLELRKRLIRLRWAQRCTVCPFASGSSAGL